MVASTRARLLDQRNICLEVSGPSSNSLPRSLIKIKESVKIWASNEISLIWKTVLSRKGISHVEGSFRTPRARRVPCRFVHCSQTSSMLNRKLKTISKQQAFEILSFNKSVHNIKKRKKEKDVYSTPFPTSEIRLIPEELEKSGIL